jgi:hypothetical protein
MTRNAHNKRIYASGVDVLIMSSRNISSVVSAEKTLMNNRNKHELLIINLATVWADGNSKSMPA